MPKSINSHPDVDITHHFANGVYSKEIHVPAGFKIQQHKHKFDHMSILASGIAVVEKDGEINQYTGPTVLNIAADRVHAVYALTDVVWFCIHATDETDVDNIDHELIKES